MRIVPPMFLLAACASAPAAKTSTPDHAGSAVSAAPAGGLRTLEGKQVRFSDLAAGKVTVVAACPPLSWDASGLGYLDDLYRSYRDKGDVAVIAVLPIWSRGNGPEEMAKDVRSLHLALPVLLNSGRGLTEILPPGVKFLEYPMSDPIVSLVLLGRDGGFLGISHVRVSQRTELLEFFDKFRQAIDLARAGALAR